jgi:hypothetical protein
MEGEKVMLLRNNQRGTEQQREEKEKRETGVEISIVRLSERSGDQLESFGGDYRMVNTRRS